MLVGAVDIVGQVPTNRLADLTRLEVGNDLVVELHLDHVASFARADPGADMLPNTVRVRQYHWHAFAHHGGQVTLLAESFECAEVVGECLSIKDPGEVLCVVDGVEAIAMGRQLAFEGWQGGL